MPDGVWAPRLRRVRASSRKGTSRERSTVALRPTTPLCIGATCVRASMPTAATTRSSRRASTLTCSPAPVAPILRATCCQRNARSGVAESATASTLPRASTMTRATLSVDAFTTRCTATTPSSETAERASAPSGVPGGGLLVRDRRVAHRAREVSLALLPFSGTKIQPMTPASQRRSSTPSGCKGTAMDREFAPSKYSGGSSAPTSVPRVAVETAVDGSPPARLPDLGVPSRLSSSSWAVYILDRGVERASCTGPPGPDTPLLGVRNEDPVPTRRCALVRCVLGVLGLSTTPPSPTARGVFSAATGADSASCDAHGGKRSLSPYKYLSSKTRRPRLRSSSVFLPRG